MAPSLALLFCFALTLAFFAFDSGNARVTSKALWIPTLWMLICGSRMVSGWLGFSATAASTENYADGSPLDRNIFLLLIVAALVVVLSRGISLSKLIRNNSWMCLFLLYCAMSIAWSDFAEVSFKRYVKEIGNLLMALIVLSDQAPLQAVKTLMRRCAYVLMPLSIVLYRYFPKLGRTYGRWSGAMAVTGVTNNKNSLGVLCAICTIGLFWILFLKWRRRHVNFNKRSFLVQLLAFATTVWVLYLAKSATSYACVMVAICIIVVMQVKAIRRNIGLYGLVAICLLGILYTAGDLMVLATGSLGRDETLTGRTEIWQRVTGMVTNPLIGGGYSRFWQGRRLETLWSEYPWHPTEAHDGYLDIYLDLGLIGVTLLALAIIAGFRNVLKGIEADFEYGLFRLTILTVAVLYNITESAFRPGTIMYFFFVLAIVHLPRQIPIARRSKAAITEHREAPVAHISVVSPFLSPAQARVLASNSQPAPSGKRSHADLSLPDNCASSPTLPMRCWDK